MSRRMRVAIFAVILLAALFSLPFWLPNALAAVERSAAVPASAEQGQVEIGAEQPAALAGLSTSPLLAQESDPVFLLDSGRFIGSEIQTIDAPPQLLAWVPATGQARWLRETGFTYGAIYDSSTNRIILIEQRNAKSQSLEGVAIPNSGIYPSSEWPLFLSVIDASNGDLINATEVSGRFFNSATSGAAVPLLVRNNTLYLMNYGSINNIATFDLASGTLSEERWDVCEGGYPTQVSVSDELNSIVALCVDYSTSEMKGSVSHLSLADGALRSLDLGLLGDESYMGGNGLVLGQNDMAYVVDNDAGVILEIDLESMQIVRQAEYQETQASVSPSLGERIVAWLLEQAATPAAAKRMFAVTALSPDGSTLAVSGGMLESGGTRTVHLIDLTTLQATRTLSTSATPAALLFRGDDLLIAFYERSGYASPMDGMVYNLKTEEQDNLSLEVNGYLAGVLTAE